MDAFTSGLRGEVVAAGGWIGTGAGTGEGLDKHEEADETVVDKLGAEGPLECKQTVLGWCLGKQ